MMSIPSILRPFSRLRMATVVLLSASLVTLSGCNNDDDDDQPALSNITDAVVNNADFSLLEAAVVRAGLADALRTGTLTVFAPTNAAFQAAGFANEAAINAAPVETLQAVLQYHVVGQRIGAADIPTAANTAVPTLSNGTLYVTKDATGVSVNGARVTQADLGASNGVIHVIDRVLMPATQNIVQIAQANPELSLLVAAVTRGGAPVLDALSAAGPLTVLAPTNAAFQAAGFADAAAINAAPVQTLTNILTYHVIASRAFSTNLTDDATVTTAQGGTLRADVSNTGVSFLGNGNNNQTAKVTRANILATNGVVHVIDRVLLP
ncbi:fasciclin domain-containing protein [Larkinella arboricola]